MNEVCRVEHQTPGYTFLHDFALTPTHYVLVQNPVGLDPGPFLLGKVSAAASVKWIEGKPAEVHLLRRPVVGSASQQQLQQQSQQQRLQQQRLQQQQSQQQQQRLQQQQSQQQQQQQNDSSNGSGISSVTGSGSRGVDGSRAHNGNVAGNASVNSNVDRAVSQHGGSGAAQLPKHLVSKVSLPLQWT